MKETTLIHKTPRYSIRIKEDETYPNKVHVYVNEVRDGDEYLPLGYVLGLNALIYECKPRVTKGKL